MGRISNEEVLKAINDRFGDQVTLLGEPFNLLTFETSREVVTDLLTWLKESPVFQFIYLTDITGIHYPDNEKQIGVIYHLHSLVNNIRVRIKVFLKDGDVHIPTATTLWDGANWMERETYDYFGIIFDGHPDLKKDFECR